VHDSRPPTSHSPQAARRHPLAIVHLEDFDSCTADTGKPNYSTALRLRSEVPLPLIRPGIEKRHHIIGQWIYTMSGNPLSKIAW